jgi:hypothetical protein
MLPIPNIDEESWTPDAEAVEAMGKYNEELTKAGCCSTAPRAPGRRHPHVRRRPELRYRFGRWSISGERSAMPRPRSETRPDCG